MKSAKRRKVFPTPVSHTDPFVAQEVRTAGYELYQHLVSLYALGKLSAKDLCVASHYAASAAVPGGDFESLAMDPSSQSGKFQAHLDRVLPSVGPLVWVSVPLHRRFGDDVARETRLVPMRPPHEALAREIMDAPGIVAEARKRSWPSSYSSSPVVLSAGPSKPIPVSIYLDGVRFTAPTAARSESIIGYWLVNEVSGKRHLLATLRTGDLCRCGCRGQCSTGVIMEAIAWSCRAMLSGRRPTLSYTGLPFDRHGSDCSRMLAECGDRLPCEAMILYIKGDWAEVQHSLGLPSITSRWNPCPFCQCTSHDMHDRYSGMTTSQWPWPLRHENYYEEACRAAEVLVNIVSEADRHLVSSNLAVAKGKKYRGCHIKTRISVGDVLLERGDRLMCQKGLFDYAMFGAKPLPFSVTFWRARYIREQCRDAVIFKCPLFSSELGTNPVRTLAIDSLHSIYYGPMQRLASTILWRVIQRNPWGWEGTQEAIKERSCGSLRSDLFGWYDDIGMDSSRRMHDLTVSMLGDGPDGDAPSSGSILKVKAAETSDVLRFCVRQLDRYDGIVHGRLLQASASSLLDWNGRLHDLDVVIPPSEVRLQNERMQRHLLMAQQAGVSFVPKHHAAAHASARLQWQGNCRVYSTFVDESLNLVLRTAAQFAHRANHALRVLQLFTLQGRLGLNKWLFGASDDD